MRSGFHDHVPYFVGAELRTVFSRFDKTVRIKLEKFFDRVAWDE